jgi:hypothetical protein
MNRKKLAVAVAGAASATALIGVGAGASFTDAVAASQSVTAGTLNVGIVQAGGGKSLTLQPTGLLGSTFATDPQAVTIVNKGDITANAIFLSASDELGAGDASAALESELHVKITSYNAPNEQGGSNVVWEGKLTDLIAHGQQVAGPLSTTDTDQMEIQFYAGGNDSNGNPVAPLDNFAEGGSVTPTITVQYSA